MTKVVEYEGERLRALAPWPDARANKYTRGKLVVIAGSAAYPGAACLAARAAQRAGAGYVEVICAPESVNAVRAYAPSLVVRSWEGWCWRDVPVPRAERPCACVVGPGFDVRDEQAREQALEVIARVEAPVLVDGGAVAALTSAAGLRAASERARCGRALVVTPHGGEAARMAYAAGLAHAGGPEAAVDANVAPDFACALARAYCCTVVLKGPDTYIARGDAWDDVGPQARASGGRGASAASARASEQVATRAGALGGVEACNGADCGQVADAAPENADKELFPHGDKADEVVGACAVVMREGTSALAKAGTGDVLAGVVGALLAQGLDPLDAGVLGATLHARAGIAAEHALTSICVTPEDVIDSLSQAFATLR